MTEKVAILPCRTIPLAEISQVIFDPAALASLIRIPGHELQSDRLAADLYQFNFLG